MKFIEKNPNRKVINCDLDNTLTNGENAWEQEPTPYKEHINIIRKLYQKGYIIIIHTARPWEYAAETVAWLIKNGIFFHGLYMQKGGSDYYCDDKSASFDDLKKLLDTEILENMEQSSEPISITTSGFYMGC